MMKTFTAPAPTQRLRSLIADCEAGLAASNELINELSVPEGGQHV